MVTRLPLTKQEAGRIGEKTAAAFLTARGYRLLERNWRCRSGEIDIIAEHETRLIFIEVRTRQAQGRFGTAAESVDFRKQRKLRQLAQIYMQQYGKQAVNVQFDVVAITLHGHDASIEHIKQAF